MGHQPPMSKTLQEQKREILQEGIKKILEDSSIPQRMHVQMVQALKTELDNHREFLAQSKEDHSSTLEEAQTHFDNFNALYTKVSELVDSLEKEIERVTMIEHLQGETGPAGKNAKEVDFNKVIEALKPFIPEPLQGERGNDGESAEIDIESLSEEVVAAIKKEKLLDVSDLRNAQTFIFNKKKYKIEELMRGAGGGSTTSGQTVSTQYLLSAVQSGNDVTIDLTQLSHWLTFSQLIGVYRNNIPQTQGASYNFTVAGSVLTIFGADASEIYNITYAFN